MTTLGQLRDHWSLKVEAPAQIQPTAESGDDSIVMENRNANLRLEADTR